MGICHMLWSVPGLAWGRPHNRLMHRCWKLARSNGRHFLRYLAQGRWRWSFGVNSTRCVPTRWGPRHNQASLAVSCRSILREVNAFTSTDATHLVHLLCQDVRKQPLSLQVLARIARALPRTTTLSIKVKQDSIHTACCKREVQRA